jgi:MYXO-CTERM domain-containing protein
MKKTALLLGIVAFSQSALFGAVVSDTNIQLNGVYYYPQYQYTLTILQAAENGSPTSIFFDRSGEFLIYQAMNLDEGSSWYFTNYGDVFNAAAIGQGQLVEFFGMNQSFHVGYGEFYMGVNTAFDFSFSYDIFGWAHFRNSEAGLELLGSGVSYDYPGIIIGTTNVPEPSAVLLGGLGMLLLLRRRVQRDE